MTEGRPDDHGEDQENLGGEPMPQEDEVVGRVFRAEAYRYAAPVPPPAWMEHYERIVSGSARQMMEDMHEQSRHRMDIESKEAAASIRLAGRGQWFGFITAMTGFVVVMTAIVGGLALIYAGRSVGSGLTLALIGLAALAAVFVSNGWTPGRAPNEEQEPVPVRQELPPGT